MKRRVILAAIVVLVALIGLGAALFFSSLDSGASMNRGWAAMHRKEYRVALDAFEESVASIERGIEISRWVELPRHERLKGYLWQAHWEAGGAAEALGEYRTAESHYKKGLSILEVGDPYAPIAHALLVKVYRALGETGLEREQIELLIGNYPERIYGYALRGEFLMRQGDWVAAKADLQRGMELGQQFEGPFREMAWLLATCPDESLRDGELALEYSARQLGSLDSRGLRASAPGRRRDWWKPLEIGGHLNQHLESPEWVEALDAHAAAFAEVGQFEKALGAIDNAVRLQETLGTDEKLLSDLKARREFYRDGKPWRSVPKRGPDGR
jgi:tetratricopeptide (TPR) repeat protein